MPKTPSEKLHAASVDAALEDLSFLDPLERGEEPAVVERGRGGVRRSLDRMLGGHGKGRMKKRNEVRGVEELEPLILMDGAGIVEPEGIRAAEWGPLVPGTPEGALESMVPNPGHVTYQATLSPDGRTMATTSSDGSIKLWNARTGELEKTLLGHGTHVIEVDFSPDGTKLASASYDKTFRLWDVATGTVIRGFDLPNVGHRVQFSPDGGKIAIAVHANQTQILDLATWAVQLVDFPALSTEMPRFDFTPDGTGLVHIRGKNVGLYDVETGRMVHGFEEMPYQIYAVDVDPTGRYLAAGDDGGNIGIWEMGSKKRIIVLKDHAGKPQAPGGVHALGFDSRGAHLMSAEFNGTVIVRDIAALREYGEPAEIARYQGQKMPSAIESTSGSEAFLVTTVERGTSRVTLYDLPDPPADVQGVSALGGQLASLMAQNEDAEAPIKPDLSVVKIEGLTVLVQFSSPVRKSVVSIGPRGVLSRQEFTHPGGTDFHLGYVTFDSTVMSGDYVLSLNDGETGVPLDGIGVRWNMKTKTLSLIEPGTDTFARAAEVDTSTFDRIMSLQGAYMADRQIDIIQQARLLDLTNQIGNATDFALSEQEVLERIERYHPQFAAANRGSPTWNENSYLTFVKMVRQGMEYHTKGMMELLQAAVDGLIQVRKGLMNERAVEDRVNEVLSRWVNPAQNQYRAQAGLAAQAHNINIFFPSRGHIIDVARQLLDLTWEEMLRRHEDVTAYRRYVTAMNERGLRQTAEGQWVAASGRHQSDLPPEMDRREIALAAKIRRTLEASSDPRVLALNAVTRDRVALEMSRKAMSEEMNEGELMAMADTVIDAYVEGVSVRLTDVGGSPVSSAEAVAAQETVNAMSRREVLLTVLDWHAHRRGVLSDALPLRTDTMVGQMMSGAMEKLWTAGSAQERWKVAAMLQALTDIPAYLFIGHFDRVQSAGGSDVQKQSDFGRRVRELLGTAQYGHLFEGYRIAEEPYVVAARPDIPAENGWYDGTRDVRLRFDVVSHGKEIRRVEVWHDGKALAHTSASSYITVPFEAFRLSAEGLRVKLVVTFMDNSKAEILSEPFNLKPGVAPVEPGTVHRLSVSGDPVEDAILSSILNGGFVVQGAGWKQLIASDFHTSADNALHAIDLNWGVGSADNEKGVFSFDAAEVFFINFDPAQDKSTLILKHTAVVDGQEIEWFSKYLHMDKIGRFDASGNLIGTIAKGDRIEKGMQFGEVGDIGSPGQFHLHVEFLKSMNAAPINAVKMMETLGIKIVANDFASQRGEVGVSWNLNLNQWIATDIDSLGLAFIVDPNEYTAGQKNVWVAWHADPTQRKQVRFDYIETSIGRIGRWLKQNSNDGNDVWDPVNKNWTTLSQSLSW